MTAEMSDGAERLLARIQGGMEVHDHYGEKVGKVKQVYLGGEDLSEAPIGVDAVLSSVPANLRGSLAATGFVEIATGLLHPNLYATGAQVNAVQDDGVWLKIGKEDLAKK